MSLPSRLRSLGSLLLLLLLVLCAVCGRELHWIAEGEGSLQDAANWDAHELPTAEDDVVIALPVTSPSSSPSSPLLPFRTASLLFPAFSPASLDDVEDTVVLSLTSPLRLSSLSLTGSVSLIIDQPLSIDSSLSISPHSIVRVRNGELTVSSIRCKGVLTLELGSLASSAITASAAASSSSSALPTGSLTVALDGLLLASGSGSNHLHGFTVDVAGGLVAINAPLLLDRTVIRVAEGGVLVMGNELVSVEGVEAVSQLVIAGTLLVTGEEAQSLVLPVVVEQQGGVRLLSSASLSLLSPLQSAGSIVLSQHRRLVTTAAVTLLPSSSLQLQDSASLLVQSSVLSISGGLSSGAGTDIIVASATLNASAAATVSAGRLTLRAGSICGVEAGASVAVAALRMEGGQLAGDGELRLRDGRLSRGAAPKVVDGLTVRVEGRLLQEGGGQLLLRGGAQLVVSEGAEYSMQGGAVLRCDDDSSSLLVDGALLLDSSAHPRTGGGDDDASAGDAAPTSISVLLVARGILSLLGSGTAVLRRSATIAAISSQGSTLSLQAAGDDTAFTFTQPLQMQAAGSVLELQRAKAHFLSNSTSRIDSLRIRDGQLSVAGGLQLRLCTVGSPQAPGSLQGDGLLETDELLFQAGEMRLPELRVRLSMRVERAAAKALRVSSLLLQPASSSRFVSTTLSLSPSTTVLVERGATLTLGPAVTVHSGNASEEADAGQEATLRVRGALDFGGSGYGSSSLQVRLVSDGSLVLNNSNAGLFSVQLRAVSSSSGSSVSVSAGCALLLSCPLPVGSSCTYGSVTGDGALQLVLGEHLLPAPVSVGSLLLTGGVARFLAPVQVSDAVLTVGGLILHSSLSVSRLLHWSGGSVRGYPLLGSSVSLLPSAQALLDSADTVTLDGVALLLGCRLRWTGGDLMMSNAALLSIKEGAAVEIRSGKDTAAIVSDSSSSRIENGGELSVSTSLTVFIPVVNTGSLRIRNGSVLSLHADYLQMSATSSLLVEAGSRLDKSSGGHLLLVQGSLQLRGQVRGGVEAAGRVLLGGGAIDGDLILTPTSSLLLLADELALPQALAVNGSLFASGAVQVRRGTVGSEYALLSAVATHGAFLPSLYGSISYTNGAVSIRVTDSSPTSALYASSLTSASSLYLPFLRLPDSLTAAFLLSLQSSSRGELASACAEAHHALQSGCQGSEGGGGGRLLGLGQAAATALLLCLGCLVLALAASTAGLARWRWRERHRKTGEEGGRSADGRPQLPDAESETRAGHRDREAAVPEVVSVGHQRVQDVDYM